MLGVIYQHDLKGRGDPGVGGGRFEAMSDQYLVEELGAFVRDAQLSAMSGNARAARDTSLGARRNRNARK